MPRPVTGRRPDSLFDNRYRYDYIYPRGRSGETLRAYDTLQDNRPVVIKRPALQDAPPIRAGQEVCLLNEKRALELLTGHPVLCELLHTGTFRVGGQAHHYLVIEMAQGETVESMVLDLAARGARLPSLEMLNIIEGVLDLLQAAHDRGMVYNDADAKHLFWDREQYTLKMIDWGNVVFLDADHPSAHVTRATDILHTGQLMYFILSGGHRLESGRADPASDLGDEVPARLKEIINKAVHPDPALRYAEISPFRRDLAEVRRPIHKNREALVERVRGRLTTANSQTHLEELRNLIQEALIVDPGYPPARELLAEVGARLRHLALQGDLDAVRIYLESGNLAGAESLLDDLVAREDTTRLPVLLFLQDACVQLGVHVNEDGTPSVICEGLSPALDALYREDPQAAARILMTTPESRADGRLQQYLLAERLSLRIPGITLLRPHLVRLEDMIAHLPPAGRLRQAVQGLIRKLDEPVATGIRSLIRVYQHVADLLVGLESEIETAAREYPRPGDTPQVVAGRARQVADNVVELLEVVSQHAITDPSRAGNALWHAASIDPGHPAFEAINNLLSTFHSDLDALRRFAPAADGANIAEYLVGARMRLRPYASDIDDPIFKAILAGIETASGAWTRIVDSIALGGRRPAADACAQASEAIRPLNASLAAWFDDLLRRVEEAPHVEQLSPNTVLGRALAEGWDAWDRGRGQEAMLAGKRAADAAATDAEKLAAQRLIGLSEALERWMERDGTTSPAQMEATERRILSLFVPEEESIRATFAAQMPTLQIYLKAMLKGVVEPLRDASAAGVRILFFDYVLRGMRALYREQFDEATSWLEAAGKTLHHARTHPAFQVLEHAIVRRQLVNESVRTLNNTRSVAALDEARHAVRAPLAAPLLEQADQALRAVDESLRRWPDGDFRAARQQLDIAIERTNAAQGIIGKDLGAFKLWLQDLADSAEILAQARRVIEQAALVPADEPDPDVTTAHQKLVDVTRRDLGEAYTAQLRQWRDTYNGMRDVYTDPLLTRDEKLRLMEGHFASLFIARQPALPIFRHWQEVVQQTPDPTPPASSIPVTALDMAPGSVATEGQDLPPFLAGHAPRGSLARTATQPGQEMRTSSGDSARQESDTAQPQADSSAAGSARGRSIPPVVIAGGLVLTIILIVALIALGGNRGADGPIPTPTRGAQVTLTGSEQLAETVAAVAAAQTDTPEPPPVPSATPTVTALPPTPTSPPPSPETPVPTPTRLTPIPTGELIEPATLAPLITPSATPEPTLAAGAILPGTPLPVDPSVVLPTVPPQAPSGLRDVLVALGGLPPERATWDTNWFGLREGVWQLGNPMPGAGRGPLIRVGPDILTPLFGADAARFLRRMDITLELAQYEPSLLPTGRVFFGAGFESLQGQRAAVEAKLIQPQVLDVRVYLNTLSLPGVQIPSPQGRVQITIERNEDRTLSLYLDGQRLGQSNATYAPGVPLSMYLYASTGGVLVNVTSFTIQLEQTE
jgi:hypothetical protein